MIGSMEIWIRRTAFLCAFVTTARAEETPLTLMSYNVWKQWSQVDDGFRKGVDSIRAAKADVIGMQEATTELAQKVADELGWFRAEKGDGTAQIVSRFPIVDSFAIDRLTGARIRLSENPRREIVVFNCHLDFRFYGPYAARLADATPESVLAEENRSGRAPQMRAMLEVMRPFLAAADETPVFLTGDFNGPSHLDWTAATASAHANAGAVAWPASTLVTGAGMLDSFRTAHPDPVADPGNTWSTIHRGTEPQDRIDFIYHMGGAVHVTGSRVFASAVQTTVGEWSEAGNMDAVRANTWPSDHSAVLTEYRLGK